MNETGMKIVGSMDWKDAAFESSGTIGVATGVNPPVTPLPKVGFVVAVVGVFGLVIVGVVVVVVVGVVLVPPAVLQICITENC